jgi:hypothetical protein
MMLTQDWLSKSCYGNKRSDLFNLFRMHNGTGFTVDFEQELSNLCMVFIGLLQLRIIMGQESFLRVSTP